MKRSGWCSSADAKPEMLEKLVKQAPEEDFYLLRLISEHPRSNAKTLQKLGPPSVRRDSRKCCAPSECRRHYSDLSQQGSQPAAVVSGGVQSQYAARRCSAACAIA